MYFYEDAEKVVAHNAENLGDGDSMFVKAGITIGSKTDWDGIDIANEASVQVAGTIISLGGNALFGSGNSNYVNVVQGGAILGNLHFGAGVLLAGSENHVFNDGTVSGCVGVEIQGRDSSVNNTGHITGGDGAGLKIIADSTTITNSGTIASSGNSGIIFTGSGGVSFLSNTGLIAAGHGGMAGAYFDAISVLGGEVTITNTGHIAGNISLGEFGDVYDGSDGTIAGAIYANGGDDVITTGNGKDLIHGGDGADTMDGGAGHDNFDYFGAHESTGAAHDTIVDFDATKDSIGIGAVTGMDAAITTGALNDATFDADLAHAVNKTHLLKGHAVLFTPKSGDEAGETFLIVDANGKAGYQAGKDFVIELQDAVNLDHLNAHDFHFAL